MPCPCKLKLFMFRKIFFLLSGLYIMPLATHAQMDIQVGYGQYSNGNNGYPAAIQDDYEGSRAQYLYRTAELNSFGLTKGKISAITFHVNNLNNTGTVEQYNLKIGTTNVNIMPITSWLSGMTTVYGPVSFNPVQGDNTFTFTAPFDWNGIDNLVVEICNGDPNNASAVTYTRNCTVLGAFSNYNCAHTYIADNLGNLCNTPNVTQFDYANIRPNTTFTWVSTDSCLPVNVPYKEDFEFTAPPNLPVCTSVENVGSGNSWYISEFPVSYFPGKRLGYYSSPSQAPNVWFYTRGIQLIAGISYHLAFRYGNYSTVNNLKNKLNIFYGTAPLVDSMNNLIVDYPSISNNISNNSMNDFTPSNTGVYYIGFHAYSDANQGYLFADDIVLSETSTTPVKLLSFTGTAEGTTNVLQWQTATEANNSGFALQRSADGLHFSPMAFIKTKAINGNSSLPLSYGYTDNNPFVAITYYRLQQTDKDGKYSYSNIVAIKGTHNNELVISNVFPNPAKDRLYVSIITPTTQNITILLTDLTGKIVLQQNATLQKGDNTQTINIAPLSSGVYMLKVVCSNGCVSAVSKVVKEGGE